MKNMSPGQSRLLAVLLLVLVIMVLARLVLAPVWSSWRDYGDRIESLEGRIAVYDRLITSLPADRERLAQLRSSLPSSDWYLSESTPALAAASLQQLLHRQVSRSGGEVISTQIIGGATRGAPLETVSIQVHLRGEISDLVDLLYALESGRPVLFVDNLTVLANPRRQVATRRNQSRERIQQLPALDIRFDLTGYAGRETEL